jgi:hypothetical protein
MYPRSKIANSIIEDEIYKRCPRFSAETHRVQRSEFVEDSKMGACIKLLVYMVLCWTTATASCRPQKLIHTSTIDVTKETKVLHGNAC